MPESTPPVFGNRYQLVRHIARGGMAQVYLARDLFLDRPVALKVLFPELSVDRNFVERFRREARAAANLSHPNIVSIYDWGQGDRTYFIVMEYVDGHTLSSRIRRSPLPPRDAAGVASSVAAALAFAHRHSVIHRDVKPGNVLIDRSGQVKVTDFGIARAIGTSENLTQAGSVMGTATYFSPEQAQGHAVDARSDVYSLGVVLYEMVVGRPPFQGDNPVAIAYKHVREQPEAPTSRNPSVPVAYEAIVLKAMAKNPADRYQSADELRADLERFRAGRPVLAEGTTVRAGDATAMVPAVDPGLEPTRVTRPRDPTQVITGGPGTGRPPPGVGGPPPPMDDEEEDDEGGGRSHTARWVSLLIVLLAILAVVVFFILRDADVFGTPILTVPSVAGQTAAKANSTLSSDGFTKVTEHRETSPKVHAGLAIGTSPTEGTRIKADAPLVLDVSSGPGDVVVPSVNGDSESTAVGILKARGFATTTSTAASTTVGTGDVIRTDPRGGSKQARGSLIKVIVSSGPPLVAIPPVANDTPTQAATTLSGKGLDPVQQSQSSSTVAQGVVIGTSPGTGEQVTVGSEVTILVSSGPASAAMPDLKGDTQAKAASALAAQGLKANFIPTTVTDPSQNGLVQSTTPAAGTPVTAGQTVAVVIGSYNAPSTTTTTTTTVPASTTTTTTTTPAGAGATGQGATGQGATGQGATGEPSP